MVLNSQFNHKITTLLGITYLVKWMYISFQTDCINRLDYWWNYSGASKELLHVCCCISWRWKVYGCVRNWYWYGGWQLHWRHWSKYMSVQSKFGNHSFVVISIWKPVKDNNNSHRCLTSGILTWKNVTSGYNNNLGNQISYNLLI